MKASVKVGSDYISLNRDVARVGYVPNNERGYDEQIFAFRGSSVPTALSEPELFRNSKVESPEKRQVLLSFPDQKSDVILITKWEDDKFRRENRAKIKALETLRADEMTRDNHKYVSVQSR